MQLIGLTIFLHIVLGSMTRMVQGVMPMHITLTSFKRISQPWFLMSFKMMRLVFLLLLLYNSTIMVLFFHQNYIVPYYSWYMGTIFWIKPFTSCRFGKAFYIMVPLTIAMSTFALELHEMIPNAVWSVYLLYLSAWYRYCLPI